MLRGRPAREWLAALLFTIIVLSAIVGCATPAAPPPPPTYVCVPGVHRATQQAVMVCQPVEVSQ